jgi:hypothetical protein
MLLAIPDVSGLGKLAQIADLGQGELGQVVDQVCDVGGAGKTREELRFG